MGRILILGVWCIYLTKRILHNILTASIALAFKGSFLLRLSNVSVTFVQINNWGRSILLFFACMCCVSFMYLGHLHLRAQHFLTFAHEIAVNSVARRHVQRDRPVLLSTYGLLSHTYCFLACVGGGCLVWKRVFIFFYRNGLLPWLDHSLGTRIIMRL